VAGLRLLLLVALAGSLPACLTNQYEVSQAELQRLAQTPPEKRADRIRVVQQTEFASDDVGLPPEPEPEPEPEYAYHGGSAHVWLGPYPDPVWYAYAGTHPVPNPVPLRPPHPRGGTAAPAPPVAPGSPRARVPASPGVAAAAARTSTPPSVGPRAARVPASPSAATATRAAPAGSRTVRFPSRPSAGSRSASAAGRTPHRSSSRASATSQGLASVGNIASAGDGDAAAALAVAGLVVAAGAMAVAAPTEGGRYDGWLRASPDQSVAVVTETGHTYWVPIHELTPQDAERASHGVIVDDGGVDRLRRAPLDRVGMTFSLELGAAAPSSRQGIGDAAFQSRLGFGGFFTQHFGLMVGGQFATADQAGTVFNGRAFLEGQFLPLRFGRLHLGAYGEGGYAWLLHDAPSRTDRASGAYPAAGGLLQIDLTTRLAAIFRGGAAWLPGIRSPESPAPTRQLLPEASLGLALY